MVYRLPLKKTARAFLACCAATTVAMLGSAPLALADDTLTISATAESVCLITLAPDSFTFGTVNNTTTGTYTGLIPQTDNFTMVCNADDGVTVTIDTLNNGLTHSSVSTPGSFQAPVNGFHYHLPYRISLLTASGDFNDNDDTLFVSANGTVPSPSVFTSSNPQNGTSFEITVFASASGSILPVQGSFTDQVLITATPGETP